MSSGSGPDRSGTTIDAVRAQVYRFPTPEPESDGTLTWDATVAVVVHVFAGGLSGLGWTYSSAAAARVVTSHLADAVSGRDPYDIPGAFGAMRRAARNLGTRGLVGQAISAVDMALWDLKARLLDCSLPRLLGAIRPAVPVYGSGGFTSLTDEQLAEQVAGWTAAGCRAMKIKIGEGWGGHEDRDLARVRRLGELAGPDVECMVDANGGYSRGQARRIGRQLDGLGVTWFEEPVTSDDPAGLRGLAAALDLDVAAGEYIADVDEARHLVGAVDCLQLDATRCGGFTGFLAAAALAGAAHLDVSCHCAPALHAVVGAAVPHVRNIEWFVDHVRLEPLLLDGLTPVRDGAIGVPEGVVGHGYAIAAGAAAHLVDPSG